MTDHADPQPSGAIDPDGHDIDDDATDVPVTYRADISKLEMIGFTQARQAIVGVAINAQNIDPGVFTDTLGMAGRLLARECLASAPVEQLDANEVDIAVMRAVDKFRKHLKEIVERAEARAALRAPAPTPEQLAATAAIQNASVEQ